MDSLPPASVVLSMLLSVVLPGFAVGAGLLAGVCSATRSETGRMIGGAVALAGGLAAGNFTRGLLPWWSFEPGWPSLFPATLTAMAGGVIASIASARRAPRWGLALRLITVAGCAWWLAPVSGPWSRLVGAVLILFGGALNWEKFCRDESRRFEPIVLLALILPWGLAAAVVLIHSHSARFCDMAVLLISTVAGVGFVARALKLSIAMVLTGPAVFIPALMLGGAANTFSEVPLASFILIALVPCALWCLRLPPLRRSSGRSFAIAAAIVVLLPCAAAVILALRAESLDFG